jgi:secreted trypsin-like serine protease
VTAPLRRGAFVLAIVAGLLAAPFAAWAAESDPGDGDDLPASAAIVGGGEAPAGAYPFVAGVLYGSSDTIFDPYQLQYCGATIVGARWALTAAHCVVGSTGQAKAPADVDVWAGSNELVYGTGQRIDVAQIVVHPEYLAARAANPGSGGPFADDVALLRLASDAPVAPVAVAAPGVPATPVGSNATAVGWGKTDQQFNGGTSYPHALYHVGMSIVADDDPAPGAVDCVAVTGSQRFVASDMVCAGAPGADTCTGDSGGPLLARLGETWVQIGVTSYGYNDPCGYFPGGYAEIATYSGWIHSFIDPPPATTTTPAPTTTAPPDNQPGDRGSEQPGYWMLGSDCALYAFGSAEFHPFAGAAPQDCVAMAATPDGDSYWLLDRAGHVYAFGDAPHLGNATPMPGTSAAGISSTASGLGYWVVDSHGNVSTFGDAVHHGGVGGLPLNSPIIAMTTAPDGSGYWLLAADGGVFTFGGARFWGSTGAIRLNQPVVSMAATASGNGYWLVASDGGVFAFGDASFFGSMGGRVLNRPVNGLSRTPSGSGYWMVASDGGVFAFGDASFVGSLGATPISAPVVGLEPSF